MAKTCSVPDCGKAHLAKGYCAAHYQRMRTYGDPLGGRAADGEAMRYFREVALNYNGEECLIWPYARTPKGYGRLWHDGRRKFVHRLVCEEANGPPPSPEHQAAHRCGNGHEGCCAKQHLAWKTPAENEADKIVHGTCNRGERHGLAKLTEGAVLEIRSLRGIEPQRTIAKRFGVSLSAVDRIQAGKSWSWL